ncbi:type II toxin-antitoxin system tRNA(fMet)-specific endonuclease VapC [Rothia nasimurium]|uniref:type II toxin-antitoxin system tRNA(fMet)-specific endonuclease VapC n=1 Tax=Rothia nasimurium TaxID=85336 RepID=UPI001F22500A|nr:type II toxin-antitoxin system VapC family toxin [Rothia nasimurium]
MLTYMLDTNIVIYVMKRRPPEILDTFNQNASRLCVSSITAAELFFGAAKSAQPEHNMQVVEDFLSRLTVLPYDMDAAAQFGDIKATLQRTGRIIGENDLHIAAHARSRGLVIVTNNEREFERVEALRVVNWVS